MVWIKQNSLSGYNGGKENEEKKREIRFSFLRILSRWIEPWGQDCLLRNDSRSRTRNLRLNGRMTALGIICDRTSKRKSTRPLLCPKEKAGLFLSFSTNNPRAGTATRLKNIARKARAQTWNRRRGHLLPKVQELRIFRNQGCHSTEARTNWAQWPADWSVSPLPLLNDS